MRVDEALIVVAEAALLAYSLHLAGIIASPSTPSTPPPSLNGSLMPGEYAYYYNGTCIVVAWNGVYRCYEWRSITGSEGGEG
ncbi:MAG: hypothetical protein DRK00_11245 [Thermoprotei archaeon]|nr:MAG: hypothetical protein DRK00_11245 [Thermoprotei archaeon]